MNICQFSRIMPVHSPGGMQDHVLSLSSGLARRGHSVTVITSGHADGRECETVDGVEIVYVQGSPPGRNTNSYWFGAARKLKALQGERRFDILHSQSAGAYGVYKEGLNRRFHLPLVTSYHGTHWDVLTTSWHTDFSPTNPFGILRFGALALNLLFRYLYRDLWFTRGSDVVIATSDADVGKYKRLYALDDAHIRKVYNGIDTDLFAPRDPGNLRTELQIPMGVPVLLALARLEKDKGVQNAIEVLPRLDPRVHLVVVGDGKYRPTLECLAHKRGVAARVRFVGAVPLAECARYFNLCDIFVDPTLRTDGYDLSIAEAMACGKPVIASDVGANGTLIEARSQADGILIPRGDNHALERAIKRVLEDPRDAQAMGERARARIRTRFSIPAMVDGMEQVYKELEARFKHRTAK